MDNRSAIKHEIESDNSDPYIDNSCKAELNICSNCINQSDCGILACATHVIQQCELYECCSLPKPELVGKKQSETANTQKDETIHLLGLCANCDNRMDCKLPKPSAGVWHCDVYC